MTLKPDGPQSTPGWLVAVGAGTVLLILAYAWIILPWQAAGIASAAAFAAAEFGMAGARWHDDKQS